jgi:4-amino-4-deoxy-L-arabinose transferase-like glycosyltransferase
MSKAELARPATSPDIHAGMISRILGINKAKNDDVWLLAALGLAAIANASGLFVPIVEADSALYATIAKTMVQHHDFIDLYIQGQDWLDKPHLPFWLSAISFSVFGFSTWAYKLPPFMLVLAGAFYTHAFAGVLYRRRIALAAAAIFLSAEHIIISSSNIFAESYLPAFIIGAVYHFHRADSTNSHANLVAGSLLAAAAVMTKGIFTLIPIGGAVGGGLLLGRQWRRAFHIRWLAAALLILVFISPEIYSLWRQFDSHPEKTVFDTTGVSGVRFFFWDSQFGRFLDTGPIRRHDGNPFQYFHVVLWAFLPWSIPLYGAAYDAIRRLVSGQPQAADGFNLSGGLVTFLLFSASQFQLSYYLNIAFPFFAIVTAASIFGAASAAAERLATIWQRAFVGGILAVCLALQLALVAPNWAGPAALLAMAVLVLTYLQRRPWEQWQSRLIVILTSANVFVNLFLNGFLMPALMKYQDGSEIAWYLNAHYPGQPVWQPRGLSYAWALEFYLQAPVTAFDTTALQDDRLPEGALVYGEADTLRPFTDKFRLLRRAPRHSVSRLTLTFLNPATRERAVAETWLVQIEKRQKD